MNLKGGVSELAFDVDGKKRTEVGCSVESLSIGKDGSSIQFARLDAVLPILPPGPLPPRAYVPLEELSPYRLRIHGLPTGKYEIICEKTLLGVASHEELAAGVNLNSLILRSGVSAPWEDLAKQIWAGKDVDKIGKTRWNFRVERR